MNNSKHITIEPENYQLFFKFIDYYAPSGFQGINPRDELMLELEQMMERNKQFFFFGDLLQMKILYTSKLSSAILGIEQSEVTPYHFFEATHPEDLHRYSLGRAKLFKLAQDLFVAERGYALLSTNLRIRNPNGQYSNILYQCYLFYAPIPNKTVFILQLHTHVDWYKKLQHTNHYYTGTDLSYFTFPDEEILSKGIIFTKREFEIIHLVASGLSSEVIAERLFISVHTVNTHRRTILKKSGKTQLSEVIYELKEQGIL